MLFLHDYFLIYYFIIFIIKIYYLKPSTGTLVEPVQNLKKLDKFSYVHVLRISQNH